MALEQMALGAGLGLASLSAGAQGEMREVLVRSRAAGNDFFSPLLLFCYLSVFLLCILLPVLCVLHLGRAWGEEGQSLQPFLH